MYKNLKVNFTHRYLAELPERGNNLLIEERGLISYIRSVIETAYGINAIY